MRRTLPIVQDQAKSDHSPNTEVMRRWVYTEPCWGRTMEIPNRCWLLLTAP